MGGYFGEPTNCRTKFGRIFGRNSLLAEWLDDLSDNLSDDLSDGLSDELLEFCFLCQRVGGATRQAIQEDGVGEQLGEQLSESLGKQSEIFDSMLGPRLVS